MQCDMDVLQSGEAPKNASLDCYADPEMPDCDQMAALDKGDSGLSRIADEADVLRKKPRQGTSPDKAQSAAPASPANCISCTANGKRPMESDFRHCPTPQSYRRCGPHHRSQFFAISEEDIETLIAIWKKYQDDLTWPWYEKKPLFDHEDYMNFKGIAEKVVNAMVAEYKQPMVLDQATISNTNHRGHPPHADNVQFDSVWWEGKRIRQEDEVVAAQEGAYVLWRSEKTSYRSYSSSTSLCDPNGYEGGELQFFRTWGDKDPLASTKCERGESLAFCGCPENIHAVTGVRSGFRLVFLVWTRPPNVRVPDSQAHVCYFRPGTGLGVWLTTADQQKVKAPKRDLDAMQSWMPMEDDDPDCKCQKCMCERTKARWKDCLPLYDKEPSTPSTSVGTSPRTCNNDSMGDTPVCEADASSDDNLLHNTNMAPCPRTPPQHCPNPQAMVRCGPHHGRVDLNDVLSKKDIKQLSDLWHYYQDDLSHPWYEKKPQFTDSEFQTFKDIAQKVVDSMSQQYQQPMVLDQATISSTNHIGHPPHADNVQFDSVWWRGQQLKQRDELTAARGGAEIMWRSTKTSYRSYSASVALTDPSEYGGGDLEFYRSWGDKDPVAEYRPQLGTGVAYCGCQKNVHAVTGVKWGCRLTLLVWTRPPDAQVPDDQAHVCYFRPGTGLSIWLTSADLKDYPKRRQKREKTWVPTVNYSDHEDLNIEDSTQAAEDVAPTTKS